MDIDEEFADDRRTTGGRRASDTPTVPLRDHLETLIRGVRTELHLEITDVAAKVDDLAKECRESSKGNESKLQVLQDEMRSRFHKMIGDVAALRLMEEHRQGQRDARTEQRAWVQWLPGAIAAAAAVYVSFFT